MSIEKLDSKFDPLSEDPKFEQMKADIEEELGVEGYLLKKESSEENMFTTTIEGELGGQRVKFERIFKVNSEKMTMAIVLEYGEGRTEEISWSVDSEGSTVIRGGDDIQRNYITEEFSQYERVAYDVEEKDENDKWLEKMKESYPISRIGLRCMTLNQWRVTEERYTRWMEMKEGLKEVKERLQLANPENVRNDYVILKESKDDIELKMSIGGVNIEASISWGSYGKVVNRTLFVDGIEVESDDEKMVVDELLKEYEDVAYYANEEDSPHVRSAGVEYQERATATKDRKIVNRVGTKVLGKFIYTEECIVEDGETVWVSYR
jgi:hypothetical protein